MNDDDLRDPKAAAARAQLIDEGDNALKASDNLGKSSDDYAIQARAIYDLAVTIAAVGLYIGDSIREAGVKE